jgi:hypothetical protein
MWQLLGKRGRFGTCRVHSPTANNSGNSLIRTRPLGLLKPLSANQANVESSYKTNHSSDQFLQNRPPKNQVEKIRKHLSGDNLFDKRIRRPVWRVLRKQIQIF